MSLLPQQILPPTVPWGHADENGIVTIDKNQWLFLYSLYRNSLAIGITPDASQALEGLDFDTAEADSAVLRQPISNLAIQQGDALVPTSADLPDIAKALVLAQDNLLPDPIPTAQPVAVISVGASPFTYTAPANGQVAVTGGTVSIVSFIRQGTTVATGLITGLVVVSRLDQVKVTYAVAPTMTFMPT